MSTHTGNRLKTDYLILFTTHDVGRVSLEGVPEKEKTDNSYLYCYLCYYWYKTSTVWKICLSRIRRLSSESSPFELIIVDKTL